MKSKGHYENEMPSHKDENFDKKKGEFLPKFSLFEFSIQLLIRPKVMFEIENCLFDFI